MQHGDRSDEDERPSARRWTVCDAIDFEALVQSDDPASGLVTAATDRRTVFLAWLDRRRAQSPSPSPGERYDRGRRIVRLGAIVVGLVVGVGLAGSLLSRTEAQPVNALLFFGGSVGIQLVVVVLAIVAWLLGKLQVRVQPLRDALLAAAGLFGRLVDRLDGERRTALRASWASLDLRSGRLAPLIACQTLVVTQLFAIAFNVGLLIALLLIYLPFVELRFGWQSTYSIGPDDVAAGVRIVAAPWSWLAPTLTPDAAQIAATRYTRGQAAATLPADAAHAWWPFLVSAIVFYGLLFRAVLALVAASVLRVRLARLDLTHPAANALWRRLTGPLVVSQPNDDRLPDVAPDAARRPSFAADLLVIDDALGARTDDVRARIARRCRSEVGRSIVANIDDDALHDDLAAALAACGTSIVVATPASRDPVVAVADFLRALSSAARPGAAVTVVLIGDSNPDADLDARVTIWSRFVAIRRLRVDVAAAA